MFNREKLLFHIIIPSYNLHLKFLQIQIKQALKI